MQTIDAGHQYHAVVEGEPRFRKTRGQRQGSGYFQYLCNIPCHFARPRRMQTATHVEAGAGLLKLATACRVQELSFAAGLKNCPLRRASLGQQTRTRSSRAASPLSCCGLPALALRACLSATPTPAATQVLPVVAAFLHSRYAPVSPQRQPPLPRLCNGDEQVHVVVPCATQVCIALLVVSSAVA